MSEQLIFPVKFGSVTTSNKTKTRISAKIERKHITIKTLDEIFCGRRIHGVLQNHRDADGQQRFEGMEDADGSIQTTFDCGGFSTTPDSCSVSLLLNKRDVGKSIDDFAGIEGQLVVMEVSDIPEEDKEDQTEVSQDDHPDVGPIARPKGKCVVVSDEGAAMDISVLSKFGITKHKAETLAAHVEVQTGGITIGHFESMMRKQEYWYRDIKGFGGEWITKLQDAHLAFRQKYPIPDPSEPAADQPAAESEGRDIFDAAPAPEAPAATETAEVAS